jgi:hypothetical protein
LGNHCLTVLHQCNTECEALATYMKRSEGHIYFVKDKGPMRASPALLFRLPMSTVTREGIVQYLHNHFDAIGRQVTGINSGAKLIRKVPATEPKASFWTKQVDDFSLKAAFA